jgi:hypothetical protein
VVEDEGELANNKVIVVVSDVEMVHSRVSWSEVFVDELEVVS